MKPVGYWNKERRIHWLDAVLETQEDGWDTPLYTAPRELSDEEIEGLARANVDGNASMEQLKWFAKAILKKASEE